MCIGSLTYKVFHVLMPIAYAYAYLLVLVFLLVLVLVLALMFVERLTCKPNHN